MRIIRIMSARRATGLLLGAVCLVLAACSGGKAETEEPVCVKTAVAEAIGNGGSVAYPGRTLSASEVVASFRVSGPLKQVLVDEGDYVKKGQLIAVMDARDYEVQLAATEAEYAQAEAEAGRIEALYKEQATTASVYDQARYGLAQLAEKLANHRNQLADTRLLAPASGFVRGRLHEAGETVSAGMGVVALSTDEALEVEIRVTATDYGRMEDLENAEATIGGERYGAKVVRVSRTADASQLYSVRLSLSGGEQAGGKTLTPGMSASVTLHFTGGAETCVSVPSTALLHKDGECVVWVVESGKARRQTVTLEAVHTDGSAQVKGLAAGTTVVCAGVSSLTDGQAVEAIAPASQANVGSLI